MPALRRRFAALAAFALSLTLWSATTSPADTEAALPANAELPTNFAWTSSGPLINPQPDADHDIVSVKDPSVVRHDGKWHVFGTTANTAGDWSLFHSSFRSWSQASSAPQHHLEDASAIGQGYRAAPQVLYFAPEKTWYLIYQTGLPSFSTTTDINDPSSWSAPRNFQQEMPDVIADNIGNGFWLDFWVTCDDTMCYLFSSDDNGHLYRAETTVADFPNGFDNTQIVLEDDRFDLFEAANVYKIKGTDNTYLLTVEAIGAEGRRYFRSWTAEGLNGEWTPLADTEDNPFAGAVNVAFPKERWTEDISHGEMIRAGVDQNMEIDPCHLRFLYQGMDPSAGGEYSQLPWQLALLTQQPGPC